MVIFNLCQFNSFQIQLELDTDNAFTFYLSKYLTIFLSMQKYFLASKGCRILLMNVFYETTLAFFTCIISPVKTIVAVQISYSRFYYKSFPCLAVSTCVLIILY